MKTNGEVATEWLGKWPGTVPCYEECLAALTTLLDEAEERGRKAEQQVVTDYFAMMLEQNRLGQMGQAPQAARDIAAFGSVWRSCSNMWKRRIGG